MFICVVKMCISIYFKSNSAQLIKLFMLMPTGTNTDFNLQLQL